MSELLRKIGSQTGWQLLGKAISSLSTLIFLSFITRYYGEEGTGVYTLAITYLGFFYLTADLALNAYALPYFEKDSRIWNKILGFRIIISLVLMMLAFLGAFSFFSSQPLVFLAIILGVFSILGNSLYTTANLAYQAKFRYDLSIIASSISSILSLVLIILLIKLSFPLYSLTIAHTFGWIVCAGIALYFVQKFVDLRPVFSISFIKISMRSIWPISLTLLLNVVYFRIDTFLLSFYKGIADVGVYNLAYQFFSTALVLPTFIMNPFYPLLIKAYEKSEKGFSFFVLKSILLMGLIGLLGSIVTYLLSPYVISFVAGEGGFKGSVDVLRILGLSFPAFFMSAVLMWSMVTLRLNRFMLGVYVIGLLVNLFLNLCFIPVYSFIASSWVTVFCEYLILSAQAIILLWYFKKS